MIALDARPCDHAGPRVEEVLDREYADSNRRKSKPKRVNDRLAKDGRSEAPDEYEKPNLPIGATFGKPDSHS